MRKRPRGWDKPSPDRDHSVCRVRTGPRHHQPGSESEADGDVAPKGRPGLSTGAIGGEGATGWGRRQRPRLGGLAGLQEGTGCRGQDWAAAGHG